MKKFVFSLLICSLAFGVFLVDEASAAQRIGQRLKGRILLQVEEKGEAWYVNPDTEKRHSLGRPADAFKLMRELGLGITNQNLEKIPTDNSFASGDMSLRRRMAGKILLQVEKNGEAWYVNPVTLRRHFMGRPADAFKLMRQLGLGIKNTDLEEIQSFAFDCGTDLDCFIAKVLECKEAKVDHTESLDIFGIKTVGTNEYQLQGTEQNRCKFQIRTKASAMKYSNALKESLRNGGMAEAEITEKEATAAVEVAKGVGRNGTCLFKPADLKAMLERWKTGSYSYSSHCGIGGECVMTGGDFEPALNCIGTYFQATVE